MSFPSTNPFQNSKKKIKNNPFLDKPLAKKISGNPFSSQSRLQKTINNNGGIVHSMHKASLEQIKTIPTLKRQVQEYENSLKKQRTLPSAFTMDQSILQSTTGAGLSPEQEKVARLVLSGNNVFFTGSAGTGKSYLLRFLISALENKHGFNSVAVTAPTGVAAYNIKGMTLHHFAGVGINNDNISRTVETIKYRHKAALQRWTDSKVLIIDEVSMVDGNFLDRLSSIGKLIRGNSNKEFGGIQLVVTGDFFQLPPVTKEGEPNYAFDCKSWKSMFQKCISLTKVFRQQDESFISILNEMRSGTLSQKSIRIISSLKRELKHTEGTRPTELYSRRNQVQISNSKYLSQLPGTLRIFKADDSGDPKFIGKLDEVGQALKVLELKEGAQVMLVKNRDSQLVNGSVGIVDSFCSETGFPIVKFDNGIRELISPLEFGYEVKRTILATRTQIPLILSWAISIHKAQGQTLAKVKVDLGQVFERGQAYVALSRATCLEGLQVLNFFVDKVKVDRRVVEFYKKLQTF